MSAGGAPIGRIVHVTADYPDRHGPARTPVIRTLVDLVAPRFDQEVISLTRRSPGWQTWADHWGDEGAGHASLAYTAPGRGLFHRTLLDRLGERIANRIARGTTPGLIVGHKLTVEGIAVARAAALLKVPYALSVQGNTDTRILALRPDLRGPLRRVWHGAAVVFPFAPWAARRISALLGERARPVIPLPCPTALDTPIPPVPGGDAVVSAFHLHNWQGKNLPRLAAAGRMAGLKAGITVIGGGNAQDMAQARRAAGAGIVFAGPVDHAQMAERFNRAIGMALPSRRESFGLVFIEALFAGCPIIYPRGRAVDGWLDGLDAAIAVNPDDTAEIAHALNRLVVEEHALKRALADWQHSADAARFRRDAIARTFGDALAMAAGHPA